MFKINTNLKMNMINNGKQKGIGLYPGLEPLPEPEGAPLLAGGATMLLLDWPYSIQSYLISLCSEMFAVESHEPNSGNSSHTGRQRRRTGMGAGVDDGERCAEKDNIVLTSSYVETLPRNQLSSISQSQRKGATFYSRSCACRTGDGYTEEQRGR